MTPHVSNAKQGWGTLMIDRRFRGVGHIREARRATRAEEPRRFPDVTPYDFRRTHSHWMELAGIPRTRRRLYRGHGPRDVGDLYEAHEVTGFLAEDRAALLAYLAAHGGPLVKLA